jgi:O-antigen/teichoic acid export membrane protein
MSIAGKSVSRVLVTQVVDYGLRFITSVLIARALGPNDKGILTFATVVVGWLTMFGNFSLADATVYLVGRRTFDMAQALAGNLVFCLGAGLLYVAVAWAGVGSGLIPWPTPQVEVFLLLVWSVPLGLLLGNLTAILQGAQEFRGYAGLVILRSATLLAAVAAAVAWAPQKLWGIAAATVGAALFCAAVLGWFVWRVSGRRLRWTGDFLRQGFRYGVRGHVSVILQNIILRFDQFVLGATLAPVHLGLYSVAVSLSELPRMLPDAVGVVLFPKVADDPARAGANTARACRVTLVLMVVAALGLVAVAPVFIRLVYGAAFGPAFDALVWLAPSIVFLSLTKILTKYLYGVGRPHWVVLSTGASAVVTVVLIFPMVQAWGMVGAAVTSTVAYGVGALVDLALTVRLSSVPVAEFLWPRREDFTGLRRLL